MKSSRDRRRQGASWPPTMSGSACPGGAARSGAALGSRNTKARHPIVPSATTDANSRLRVRFNADLIPKISGESALADSSFYSTFVQPPTPRRPNLPSPMLVNFNDMPDAATIADHYQPSHGRTRPSRCASAAWATSLIMPKRAGRGSRLANQVDWRSNAMESQRNIGRGNPCGCPAYPLPHGQGDRKGAPLPRIVT